VRNADDFALGAYRAFFYSNEGSEPAHIHVRSGDKEAKFWLHDLSVAVNAGFRPRNWRYYPASEAESRRTDERLE